MENKLKSRVDCILDAINTLNYLIELPGQNGKAFSYQTCDFKDNEILVYKTDMFFEVAKSLDYSPALDEDEEDETFQGEAYFYYRGMKFFTYVQKDEWEDAVKLVEQMDAAEWAKLEKGTEDDEDE